MSEDSHANYFTMFPYIAFSKYRCISSTAYANNLYPCEKLCGSVESTHFSHGKELGFESPSPKCYKAKMTKTKKEKTLFENIEIKDHLETKLHLSTSHDLLLPVLLTHR